MTAEGPTGQIGGQVVSPGRPAGEGVEAGEGGEARKAGEPQSAGGPASFVDAEAALALAVELVQARSVFDGAGGCEREAAEVVLKTVRSWGWSPVVDEVAPGRPNVVVTVEGGGGPGPVLAFEGHLDVVTEGDPAAWTVGPFAGEIRGGRLYGRGAADMKSGVAAMLHAVRALQLSGPFPGAVRLLVLVDEEGMMSGAKRAVFSGALADVSAVICCEPEGDEVCPVSKGAVRLRVDLDGQIAHGAMPERGRNPLPVLGRLLGAIEALEARLQRDVPAHPVLGKNYLTPTVVAAGNPEQMNTSPPRASLYLDVRTVPGVDHASLVASVQAEAEALAGAAGLGASVTVLDDRPPVDTPATDPVVTSLLDAHERVTGTRPALGGVPGTTDGTIITRDAGLPTVVYGPGGKWIAHQADESVGVEEVGRYARVYAEAAFAYLNRASARRARE
ncbi:MAG: M20/M25/M40 family metallo-hydrolase [Actinomycetota bacterium]|nr:M20/M25/M40 family metallo-hydrolase [Actinomycetota bacterium]